MLKINYTQAAIEVVETIYNMFMIKNLLVKTIAKYTYRIRFVLVKAYKECGPSQHP